MPPAIPISPVVHELHETLIELREMTDRPYLDIPLVAHEACWIPVVGTAGSGTRGPRIPLSKGTVDLILRTRLGYLREHRGNRATLRIRLKSPQDDFY